MGGESPDREEVETFLPFRSVAQRKDKLIGSVLTKRLGELIT